MNKIISRIFPVDLTSGDDATHYAAEVAILGYESRSRAAAEEVPTQSHTRFAFGFQENQIFDYAENREWYHRHGYEIEEPSETDFKKLFDLVLRRIVNDDSNLTQIRIDISSATRYRLAVMIDCLSKISIQRCITVHFIYTVAAFSPPPRDMFANNHVGPISPEYAGWWDQPDRPTCAVVGVGYEQNKALGAVEHVQASDVWLFTPTSPIIEYATELESANATLFEITDTANVLRYSVTRPFDLFSTLESLCAGLVLKENAIIFPFGPKIFTLSAILVATIHPEIAVWRVTGAEEPSNRLSSKIQCGLGVMFGNSENLHNSDNSQEEK